MRYADRVMGTARIPWWLASSVIDMSSIGVRVDRTKECLMPNWLCPAGLHHQVPLWCMMAALVGCTASTRYIGLVDSTNPRAPQLVESSGRTYRLAVGEDAPLFAGFGGCSVLVEGPRRMRTVLVRDWAVTDAGDGSAPFIGRLTREGMRWFVDDVQTGGRVYLDEVSLGELRLHAGRTVLVAGYVSGPNTINVVRWRLLGEPASTGGGGGVP